jgi:acyl-CoA hydrolase
MSISDSKDPTATGQHTSKAQRFALHTVAASSLTLTQFMQPEHSNSLGTVHGGVVLKLCDECGGIVAARHARRPCVTVTVDTVTFHQPVRLGQLLLVHGRLTYVGTSSLEVELRVEAESFLTGEITHTNSAYFVYVALDDDRRPTQVAPLILETDAEHHRFAEGRQRQAARLARRHAAS